MTPRRSTAPLPEEVEIAFQATWNDRPLRDSYIRALYRAEWSRKSIADLTGLTVQRVWQIAVNGAESLELDPERLPVPRPPKNRSVTLSWTNGSGLGGLYARKTTLEMALNQIEGSTMFNTLWWIDGIPTTTQKQRDEMVEK